MKERTPNSPRIIYVAGGYLRHSLDTFEGFNIDDNTWTSLAKLPIPRSGLGVAFLKVTLSINVIFTTVIAVLCSTVSSLTLTECDKRKIHVSFATSLGVDLMIFCDKSKLFGT